MADARSYPERPFLAASAAIVRDGKILVVRRARPPANGLYTLPGGVVEIGETLMEAVARPRPERGAQRGVLARSGRACRPADHTRPRGDRGGRIRAAGRSWVSAF